MLFCCPKHSKGISFTMFDYVFLSGEPVAMHFLFICAVFQI